MLRVDSVVWVIVERSAVVVDAPLVGPIGAFNEVDVLWAFAVEVVSIFLFPVACPAVVHSLSSLDSTLIR